MVPSNLESCYNLENLETNITRKNSPRRPNNASGNCSTVPISASTTDSANSILDGGITYT